MVDLEYEERYDFDPKTSRKRGEMPSMLTSQYANGFQMCQMRARSLTRIAQGWPRKCDEGQVRAVDGFLKNWGLTARDFGFIDPPMPATFDVKPNTGTVFAAPKAPSVN
jgi:hypothetical protein